MSKPLYGKSDRTEGEKQGGYRSETTMVDREFCLIHDVRWSFDHLYDDRRDN